MQQYSDRLAELKSELKSIHGELTLGLDEADELFSVYARLSKIFDSQGS